eukprot:923373_1
MATLSLKDSLATFLNSRTTLTQINDLPQEFIGEIGDFLNHSDLHSLRSVSRPMRDNQRLLTNPNYRTYSSFLKRSFNALLNRTATRALATLAKQITMEDLKRIPRTDPFRINQSALEKFMDQNKNNSCIFIGIDIERNKPFIAFKLRPVAAVSICGGGTGHWRLKFVFGESTGNDTVDIYATGDEVLQREWHWSRSFIPTQRERLFLCAKLIKVGDTTVSEYQIPLILLNKPMTFDYVLHRYPALAACGEFCNVMR